ncbi:SIR2 family protein [Fructilactobacillus frigidiflavus]|uniref:SIR2 family protein n=1 Tax=Fructilactobacillus frigidiflavus TaxID=3242688 RepID=UPI00375831AF
MNQMLKEVIKNNHYPIIFIGSGISKRYLINSPSWTDLLEKYWKITFPEEDFWSQFHNFQVESNEKDKNKKIFFANIKMADKLEKEFNKKFFNHDIEISDLTTKIAVNNNISPFKFKISNDFSSYSLKDGIEKTDEFKYFIDVLSKAKIIITTNYDTFIEDILKKYSGTNPDIYIGQKGFFNETTDWSEIYKIHGSVKEPNSIVINSNDYDEYDKNSILISAKILSSMITSPILFLGYSLTDRDIRKLLSDFSKQLPKEDLRKSASRIIVVDYKKDAPDITEKIVNLDELNINYTLLEASNYTNIFKSFSKIDEGLNPKDIKKFEKYIRNLIISAGANGALKTTLVSPKDISKEDENKMVVAIGNQKNIFVTPTQITYLEDYIKETHEIMPQVAWSFFLKDARARYPFNFYYPSLHSSNLENYELNKIEKKINTNNFLDIEYQINNINKSNHVKFNNLKDILNQKNVNNTKKIDEIAFNVNNIDYNDFNNYVKTTALKRFKELFNKHEKKSGNELSSLRRLFLIWDLKKYNK